MFSGRVRNLRQPGYAASHGAANCARPGAGDRCARPARPRRSARRPAHRRGSSRRSCRTRDRRPPPRSTRFVRHGTRRSDMSTPRRESMRRRVACPPAISFRNAFAPYQISRARSFREEGLPSARSRGAAPGSSTDRAGRKQRRGRIRQRLGEIDARPRAGRESGLASPNSGRAVASTAARQRTITARASRRAARPPGECRSR